MRKPEMPDRLLRPVVLDSLTLHPARKRVRRIFDKQLLDIALTEARFAKPRQEVREQQGVTAVASSARFARPVPAGVLRDQHTPEQSRFRHGSDTLDMPVNGLWANAVKLHPGPALRHLLVKPVVLFALRVDPDESAWRDALRLENSQLFESGCARARVRGDREARCFVGQRRRPHKFSLDLRKRHGRIHSGLKDAGPDAVRHRAFLNLANKALGKLLGAFAAGVAGDELLLGRAINAGCRDDPQA